MPKIRYFTEIDMVKEKLKLILTVRKYITCSPTAGNVVSLYKVDNLVKMLNRQLKKLKKEAEWTR